MSKKIARLTYIHGRKRPRRRRRVRTNVARRAANDFYYVMAGMLLIGVVFNLVMLYVI